MTHNQKQVTLQSVQWTTHLRKEQLDNFRKAVEDPEVRARKAKCECVFCFYVNRKIGGQAFTDTECGLCRAKMVFGDTCVDMLCEGCARKHRLCKHCGSDIDLKGRTKL